MSIRFVSYLRVSTDRQGQSGLGLEAQRHQVEQHLRVVSGELITEVLEVESDRKNKRPKLAEAIALCEAY
jgi:DNA invertase Pin-like site-specific DNA recombinase